MTASSPASSSSAQPAELLSDEEFGRELLEDAIPEFASGEWELVSYAVLDRRWQLKWVAVLALEYSMGPHTELRQARVLAKMYRRGAGPVCNQALRTLWDAGFRAPQTARVPRPYGYSAKWSVLIQEFVSGAPWVSFLGTDSDALRAASESSADWLLALQRSCVSAPRREIEYERRYYDLPRFVDELVRLHPEYDASLRDVLERLEPELQLELPRLPSHGDFNPKNVLFAEGAATAIDFDTFGSREAAFDVGYAVAQLLVMSHLTVGDVGPGRDAAVAFWARYVAEGGDAHFERVSVHVARTLVQSLHFELITLGTANAQVLDIWPELARTWLNGEGLAAAARPREASEHQ